MGIWFSGITEDRTVFLGHYKEILQRRGDI